VKIPTRITLSWLKNHRACLSQRRLFKATFGNSAEISRDNLQAALKAGLRLSWLQDALYPSISSSFAVCENDPVYQKILHDYLRSHYGSTEEERLGEKVTRRKQVLAAKALLQVISTQPRKRR
jgi:hypothetical protein